MNRVINLTTSEVFNSIKLAAESVKADYTKLNQAIHNKTPYNGQFFMFYQGFDKQYYDDQLHLLQENDDKRRIADRVEKEVKEDEMKENLFQSLCTVLSKKSAMFGMSETDILRWFVDEYNKRREVT